MKILLVEDDQATQALLEKVLVAQQYGVEVAEDGRSALAFAELMDYDLVLLDIGIPELDGISVCKRLRAQGCQLPILLLTARDEANDRILGLDAGADDYMVKPFYVPELLARIRALLRRSRATSTSVITWGKLQLDGLKQEIRYDNQLLRLTSKEYGILELLLSYPQRIFSRSDMINRLWELDKLPTENAISSHIKAIRHKLKAAGATQDLIETIYGFGYRLCLSEAVAPIGEEDRSDAASGHKAGELDAAPEATPEEANAILAELWERFKETFNDQLDWLDRAIVALQEGNLTAEWRQAARQTVHQLVGSLGVYGFAQGSACARQIEDLLRTDRPLGEAEQQQMAQWVMALRQELQQNPGLPSSDTPTDHPPIAPVPSPHRPLVLVIDGNEALTAQLQATAHSRSLHIDIASCPVAAQPILDRTLPDVILLDLAVADGTQHGLNWLEFLKHQHPQIPVLVLTERNSLSDRVAVAQLGAEAFLQKSMAIEQILAMIQATLQSTSDPTLNPPSSHLGQVMIVDDDSHILQRLSAVLSPWGLCVTTLQNPAHFWDVLTDSVPDLLILDIEMPEFSGIDLCQAVRHDPQWGNLPILFLTAHHEANIIVQAFAAGGDDYIRKPVLEPELVARVLNRLEPAQLRRLQTSFATHDRQHA